jgi:hypothetical protein
MACRQFHKAKTERLFDEKSYARHEVLNGRYREDRQAAAVEFSSQMLTA